MNLGNTTSFAECGITYCDICGSEAKSRNLDGILIVVCGACPDRAEPLGSEAQHLIGIFDSGKLQPRDYYLKKEEEDGLKAVRSSRDCATAFVLNHIASLEKSFFRQTSFGDRLVKIMWAKGIAVGYYSFTERNEESMPCLWHLFVMREYRRRRFGTRMLQDFIDSHPNGDIGIDHATGETARLLVRMGYAEMTNTGRIVATGRLKFFPEL